MSQRSQWRRFVERRRRELHNAYPCAAPTQRRICPKHGTRVPQETTFLKQGEFRSYMKRIRLTQICKPCRDELYEQLAAEYTAAEQRQERRAS